MNFKIGRQERRAFLASFAARAIDGIRVQERTIKVANEQEGETPYQPMKLTYRVNHQVGYFILLYTIF